MTLLLMICIAHRVCYGLPAVYTALSPLITAMVLFNLFYWPIKSLLLGMKHRDLQMFRLKLDK